MGAETPRKKAHPPALHAAPRASLVPQRQSIAQRTRHCLKNPALPQRAEWNSGATLPTYQDKKCLEYACTIATRARQADHFPCVGSTAVTGLGGYVYGIAPHCFCPRGVWQAISRQKTLRVGYLCFARPDMGQRTRQSSKRRQSAAGH